MLTKDEILKRRPSKMESIESPAWGGSVYVREMNAAERDSLESQQLTAKQAGQPMHNFRANLVARTACDDTGARMFTDDEADALAELPADDLRPIADKAMDLNGMSEKEAKDVAGNS